MIIKVLGSGCRNCKKLEKHVNKALDELGVKASVLKVENPRDIMSYGVMSTPALVINEQVVLMGRVPSVEEIKAYFK